MAKNPFPPKKGAGEPDADDFVKGKKPNPFVKPGAKPAAKPGAKPAAKPGAKPAPKGKPFPPKKK